MNDFVNAIGREEIMPLINVKFVGSSEWARYTMAIFNLLVTDKDVEYITSEETGEILYAKEGW